MPCQRQWIPEDNGYPRLPDGQGPGETTDERVRTVVEFLAQVRYRGAPRGAIEWAIRSDEWTTLSILREMRARDLVHTTNAPMWQLRQHVGRPGGPYADLADVHPPRPQRKRTPRMAVPQLVLRVAAVYRSMVHEGLADAHRAAWGDSSRRNSLERAMNENAHQPAGTIIAHIVREWAEREIRTMEAGLRRSLPTIEHVDPDDAEDIWRTCDRVNELRAAIGWPRREWPEGSIDGQIPLVEGLGPLPFNQLPPGIVHWQKLTVWNGHRVRRATDEEKIFALQVFRQYHRLPPKFSFWATGLPHEDPRNHYTHGPQTADQVDWSGFPGIETCEHEARLGG